MIRKIKLLGALIAVLATFVVTASPAQATFTSAAYPATLSATSGNAVFDMFGSTVQCTNNSFSASLSAASTTLKITPWYFFCTAFGLPATVNFTSCGYLLHKASGVSGTLDIACNSFGDAVDINVYSSADHSTALCHLKIPPQTGKSGYVTTNSGSWLVISGSVGGLSATQSRTSIFCPVGTSTTSATFTVSQGGILFKGNNGAVSAD